MLTTVLAADCFAVLEWCRRLYPSQPKLWGHLCEGQHPRVAIVLTAMNVLETADQWEMIVCEDGSSLWRRWNSDRWEAVKPIHRLGGSKDEVERFRARQAWPLRKASTAPA
jgi:hypothetical protein